MSDSDVKVRRMPSNTRFRFAILLQITFDPSAIPGEFDIDERIQFWESAGSHLSHMGYTLYLFYKQVNGSYYMYPSLPNGSLYGGEYPYAFHDSWEGATITYQKGKFESHTPVR